MAKGLCIHARVAALNLAFLGCALALPSQAVAQMTYAESPADALTRNVKILGEDPKNFQALIAAGRAALAMGDTQAAVGFFGRADEVWSTSPLPQAGMGAAMAQRGDGSQALQFFRAATQRGATQSMIGADRGLAYDLLGQHAQAQADYRAALQGVDRDEARRRLALSLAITGNKTEALSLLSPLMARGDAAGARVRAFVLALTGDVSGARSAIEAAMPGSSREMAYFFQKLPTLRSDQKVAACNLGIFPGNGSSLPPVSVASVVSSYSVSPSSSSSEDRMGSIQQWLSQGNSTATAPAPTPILATPPAPATTQVASLTTIPQPKPATGSATYTTSKLWLQLASGTNTAAMPEQFERMKSRDHELFEGINGYVVEEGGKARLLIGPFRNMSDANIFAEDLASVRIDAFTWTSRPGQTIRKLPAE
jgi:Flp pilus assembly protein TadD